MNRQEQYHFMLEEDNDMLVEDNEILRNKLTSLIKFVDLEIIKTTKHLNECINISQDYFLSRKSILNEIKKILT